MLRIVTYFFILLCSNGTLYSILLRTDEFHNCKVKEGRSLKYIFIMTFA